MFLEVFIGLFLLPTLNHYIHVEAEKFVATLTNYAVTKTRFIKEDQKLHYCSVFYMRNSQESVGFQYYEETNECKLFGLNATENPSYIFLKITLACHGGDLLEGIEDSQFTASSTWGDTYPYFSRMSHTHAWIAGVNNPNQWIQVRLNKIMNIKSIKTKNRGDATYNFQRVTSYKLKHSQDGVKWTIYNENQAADKVFAGNIDYPSTVSHDLIFPFKALYVRLLPVTWYNHISLRWELIGCPVTKCT